MRTPCFAALGCLATLLFAGPALGSDVHLFLEADGNQLQCMSSVTDLGRADSIEAFAYSGNVLKPGPGLPIFRPIRFTKRFDKCTPLLAKALVNTEPITGEIRFYRVNPQNFVYEHYFTIVIDNATIQAQSMVGPDVHDPQTANRPQLEHISIKAGTITWKDEPSGNEHMASDF